MRRYLIYFSYIGTDFLGLQKQAGNQLGAKTIVKTLEDALQRLQPANAIKVITSSRTDKGVHALCNTVHVDLQHKNDNHFYDPRFISEVTNRIMIQDNCPIRVLNVKNVSMDFHSRYCATGRSYIYRLAECLQNENKLLMINPFDYQRIYVVRHKLDIEKMKEAASVLTGTHNFSAFASDKSLQENPWVNPVKCLTVEVKEGSCFMPQFETTTSQNFRFYDLYFHGNSFLYKQVRKMTSVIVGVGRGLITPEDVTQAIEKPNEKFGHRYLYNIPPHALYLHKVHYRNEDLLEPVTEDGCISNYEIDIDSILKDITKK